MVVLPYPRWIQGAINNLVGLFDRVGLKNNFGKTVGMVCHPFQATRTHSEELYGRRMTGAGYSYRERHWGRIQCTEWREEMAIRSLEGHMQTNHGS